ncbi:unnamed protein product [Adineta steineri]|uniref:MAM domain-containing protein n=1 Tax=Adineta steineri TaxID=433720 RepID=A0A819B6I2_9BILA|nr:unnamed protein product [Adineta steineri]CAF3788993.1 unnamed protein product [Adineta steineri]
MTKLIFIFIWKLFLISVIQSQKYLECKFDDGTEPCRLNPVGSSVPELTLTSTIILDNPSIDPIMPLSDVTSIITPTMGNNSLCQLPYKLDGNSKDIYFCSRLESSSNVSTCFTGDSSEQECLLGQYVMAQPSAGENLTYFIEVLGGSGSSCLSFYYYITRPNVGQIVTWCSDVTGNLIHQFGKTSDVPYNGWHRTEFSFSPNVTNYNLYFDLQRFESTDGFVSIALDEIKVTDGLCESDIIESTTMSTHTMPTTDQTSTTTEESITSSSTSTSSTTASAIPSSQTSFDSTVPITTGSATNTLTTMTTTIVTSTTTEHPFAPTFRCDFTTSCFGNGDLIVTNGSEFNSSEFITTSQQPPAPTSGATSITKPTNNGYVCDLPYRPLLDDDNSTTTADWDMWFCYNNQCPTTNGQTAQCIIDYYGLISLEPSETSKTINDSLTPNVMARDASEEQCLRFYYYFTVYDGEDWGQQIELRIIPNNQSDNRVLVETLKFKDMKENKWQFKNMTLNSSMSPYTLQVNFAVTAENRTEDVGMNRTVYFALDNIELYDYNCSYVQEQLNISTPTPTPATSTAPVTLTTTGDEGTPSPNPPKKDLGLILGLSLGLGGGLVLLVIGH